MITSKIWIPHLLFVSFCFVLSISSFRLYHCIIIIIEEIVGFLIQYRSILPKFYSLFILYYLSRLSMSATVFNRSKVALWCHYWQVIVCSFSSLNPLYNLYFTFFVFIIEYEMTRDSISTYFTSRLLLSFLFLIA